MAQHLLEEGVIEKFVGLDMSDADTVFDRCLDACHKIRKVRLGRAPTPPALAAPAGGLAALELLLQDVRAAGHFLLAGVHMARPERRMRPRTAVQLQRGSASPGVDRSCTGPCVSRVRAAAARAGASRQLRASRLPRPAGHVLPSWMSRAAFMTRGPPIPTPPNPYTHHHRR